MKYRPGKDKDMAQAWVSAINCSLYEEDPGPAQLNIGSRTEPLMVSRREAFRDFYAHVLLEDLGADRRRIAALADRIGRVKTRRRPMAKEVWGIATDLCQRACSIIDEAGAANDERARRRVLAGATHLIGTVALGQWVPGCQEGLDNELLQELAATEE